MAILFLPFAIWFARASLRRYWVSALALFVVSVLFLWLAVDRRPQSLLAPMDDIGGPANPDARDSD